MHRALTHTRINLMRCIRTIALAGLLAGQSMMTPSGVFAAGGNGDDRPVTIVAREFAFDPARVTVEAGQPVTVILDNEGVLSHNLAIEKIGVRTRTIQTDSSDRVTFTPESPGEYRFYCAVAGHREQGMVGTLIVR